MNSIDKLSAHETIFAKELDRIAKQVGYGRACQMLGELWDDMLEREYGASRGRGRMERRPDIDAIEKSAQIQCASMLERAAVICDEEGIEAARMARGGGSAFDDGREAAAKYCASAIRALISKEEGK